FHRSKGSRGTGTLRTSRTPRTLFREFLGELDPLALRRELLVRLPVRPRVLRLAELLERHREIEVGVRVIRIQAERFAVARLRFSESIEIVIDVAEVEVRLEEIRLEANRTLVERLCFGKLVASVVNVGEVDERRDEIGIVLERLPIGNRRVLDVRFVAVVQR